MAFKSGSFRRSRGGPPVHLGTPSPFYSQIDVPIDHSRHEIRLLDVFPGDWGDGMRGELWPVSLDADPQYHALSYVWGDASSTIPITVNGREFRVTRNLFGALRRLRPSPRHHGAAKPLVLWVDALCIDQGNSEEKSAQVAMMARIYASCRDCLVWLGEKETARPGPVRYFDPDLGKSKARSSSSNNRVLLAQYAADFNKSPDKLDYSFHTACFLYLLKDFDKTIDFRQHPLPPFWNGPRGARIPVPGLVNPKVMFPEVSQGFKIAYLNGIASVLKRIKSAEWHKRMWVVQEYALPRVVILCTGSGGVPLDSVQHLRDVKGENSCEVTKWLSNILLVCFHRLGMARLRAEFYRPRRPRLGVVGGDSDSESNPVRLLGRKVQLIGALAAWSPPAFLAWSRRMVWGRRWGTVFECCVDAALGFSTLPVDQVYSILSYLEFVGIPVCIPIHYSPRSTIDKAVAARDAARVFEHVSREHITNSRGWRYELLAPLRFSRGKTEGIRELLPSWAVDWAGQALGRDETPSKITHEKTFKANKGLRGRIKPEVVGRVLRVSGFELDVVDVVVDLTRGVDAWRTVSSWVEQDTVTEAAFRWYPNGDSLQMALLRTLTLDASSHGKVLWSDRWAFWATHWDALKTRIDDTVAGRTGYFATHYRKDFFSLFSSASDDFVNSGCRVVVPGPRATSSPLPEEMESPSQQQQTAVHEDVENIFFACLIYLQGNCMFKTRAGYFGRGGEEIAKGDEVFVLSDGDTPFVLRKEHEPSGLDLRVSLPSRGIQEAVSDSGNPGRGRDNDEDSGIRQPLAASRSQQSPQYRVVISECFIHGVMYGEASKMRLKESIVEIV